MPSPAFRPYRYFVWFYTVTIVIATLAPFRFRGAALTDLSDNWHVFWNGGTYLGDFTSNILLFMPLGWGLSMLTRSRATRRPRVLSLVVSLVLSLGLSLLLSAGVEGLQLLLPSRTSSLTDVVANTWGGALGALLSAGFATWPWPCLRSRRSQCQGLTLLLMLWLLLGLGTTHLLNRSAQLSNWDPSYGIHLGQSGRDFQPWLGNLREVAIADRALSPQQMQSQLMQTPASQTPASQTPLVPLLFHYQTGKTRIPITPPALKSALEQTSAFTLDLRFATQTLDGEAALFAFALDPWHSNWIVLRDRHDLQVQLRSPITGTYHHRELYLTVANLFQDTQPHRLTLTYGANLLHVYWDGRRQSPLLSLNADTTFWHCFLPLRLSRYRLTPWGGAIARGLFYGFWLLPLGLMLGALARLGLGQKGDPSVAID